MRVAAAIGLALLALIGGAVVVVRARRPPKPLLVNVPCVIGAPMQKVARAYEAVHRGARVAILSDKPVAMLSSLSSARSEPGVVITMGEVEMKALVASGVVEQATEVRLAQNAYHLAVVVSAESAVKSLSDLSTPAVRRVAIEDPKLSTLGNRAEQALRKLGLWKAVGPKVVRFDPTENVLSQLLEKKADAAVIYQNCLFTESGAAPRTVRVLGAFPMDSYASSTYRAAPLASRPSQQVAAFLEFLRSAEGKKALREVGLTVGS